MTVPVVAAIIRKGNRILIAQRKKDSRLEADRWEFPGGKLEFGEHPEDALRREIMEELNIRIKIRKLHAVLSHVYDLEGKKLHVVLLVFLADYESGTLKNLDVQDSKWVLRKELKNFEWVSGDRPLIKSLGR
ncbi:MAG TPA: (deoxy)nucleoside triphosphate pyrophosphohydrolase [Candidatus Bilamarchaeum sp.]|nr:(deoxy)nucleoside triphosphate pyrophosphohydrolase [Candidatus Bilamarchaeum sp.]